MSPTPRHPLRRVFRILPFRPDVSEEVRAELEFHFEEAVEALVEQGWSESEAREEAGRRFGNVARYRRDLERIGKTRMRRRRKMEGFDVMRQNLRSAFRMIRRRPGFAALVIATLGLGIGANATMFEVVDRMLLRPPDGVVAPDAVKKVYLQRDYGPGIGTVFSRSITWPDYTDLQELPSLEAVAAYTGTWSLTLGDGTSARRVNAQLASHSYLPLLGVTPALGRFYDASEDRLGAPLVAVISEAMWERDFGRDPGVLGTTLHVGDGNWEIIGVAPRGFNGVELSRIDMWLPIVPAHTLASGEGWMNTRQWFFTRAVVRLADGVSPEVATEEMTALNRSRRHAWAEENPPPGAGWFENGEPALIAGSVISARGPEPGREVQVTLWLIGVSAIVLLIACANVANLLLARGVRARRENAVRVAIGVGAGRLTGELLTQSLVLAVLSAVAALLTARWTSALLGGFLLPGIPLSDGLISPRLLAFLGVSTVVTAIFAGLLPALQASSTAPSDALRAVSRGNSGARSRVRGGLMLAQTTLSVVLLVGAGLFVRSLQNAGSRDLGFDVDHTVLLRVETVGGTTIERNSALMLDVARRLDEVPGVLHAAAVGGSIPFRNSNATGLSVPGLDSLPRLPGGGPYFFHGSEGFMDAFGIEVTRGRAMTALDEPPGGEPVLMVDERLAETAWPDADPLDQCVRIDDEGTPEAPAPCRRVVGVFRAPLRFELEEPDASSFALPGSIGPLAYGAVVVRTAGLPTDLLPTIRQVATSVSAEIRFVDTETFGSMRDDQIGPWSLGATMFSAFGVLALVLAALGLYSVLAFTVAQRQRELGIRAALGASGSDLIRMVVGQAGSFVATGVIIGLAVAWVLGGRLEDLLFDVGARDPLVYLAVTGVMLLTGLLAATIPAWRMTRVDPTRSISVE